MVYLHTKASCEHFSQLFFCSSLVLGTNQNIKSRGTTYWLKGCNCKCWFGQCFLGSLWQLSPVKIGVTNLPLKFDPNQDKNIMDASYLLRISNQGCILVTKMKYNPMMKTVSKMNMTPKMKTTPKIKMTPN